MWKYSYDAWKKSKNGGQLNGEVSGSEYSKISWISANRLD